MPAQLAGGGGEHGSLSLAEETCSRRFGGQLQVVLREVWGQLTAHLQRRVAEPISKDAWLPGKGSKTSMLSCTGPQHAWPHLLHAPVEACEESVVLARVLQ